MSSSDMAFWNLDRDGDGSLSQSEFVANRGNEKVAKKATDLFAILDQDHDGKLTLQEFTKRPPRVRFLEYGRDGGLSVAEYQTSEPTLSATRGDLPGDGLERRRKGELRGVPTALGVAEGDVPPAGRERGRTAEPGGGVELGRNGQGPKAFAAMATNRDGVLDEKEYLVWMHAPAEIAAKQVEFAQRGDDRDGWLSLKEVLATQGVGTDRRPAAANREE
jgi:hypothetical protein